MTRRAPSENCSIVELVNVPEGPKWYQFWKKPVVQDHQTWRIHNHIPGARPEHADQQSEPLLVRFERAIRYKETTPYSDISASYTRFLRRQEYPATDANPSSGQSVSVSYPFYPNR